MDLENKAARKAVRVTHVLCGDAVVNSAGLPASDPSSSQGSVVDYPSLGKSFPVQNPAGANNKKKGLLDEEFSWGRVTARTTGHATLVC